MKLKLTNYLDSLQATGRYTFTREEGMAALGGTPNAFRFSVLRLLKKKRLVRPRHGFYVIVPTEYLDVGAPPASWFIDSLMELYKKPYYVALLSAAALYGAAHQQPQLFQVMTNKPLRPIDVGRSQIQFLTKKIIQPMYYQSIKTPTGYMNVSFPEMTALDLVRYIKAAGYLSHVATVLTELQEQFDKKRFVHIVESENLELPDVQRLGYLLEFVGAHSGIISFLKQWIKKKNPSLALLRPDKDYEKNQKNMDWYLYINETIERDI